MKIALVSCTKLKQDYPCKAEEMYLPSQLFKKASTYLKQFGVYDGWFILSAKYGLLEPEKVIEPYNVTLNNMAMLEIKRWSEDISKQLFEYEIDEIDFYAGERYRKYLIPLLEDHEIRCNIPLKGLGIGQQLNFYNGALK
jgi:hypothetical protein